MANSRVAILNLALQLLGASRIGSPSDDNKNAIETNACYDILRDYEQRANAWVFTLQRAVLAPHAIPPAFGYSYAFPLPANCLRILKPSRTVLDWSVENHQGSPAILTNDGTSINLRYIGRVEDETKFDPMFTVMLACSIAWHCCEIITQSNSKKDAVERKYRATRLDARRMNAFERLQEVPPVDAWLEGMRSGQLADLSWSE